LNYISRDKQFYRKLLGLAAPMILQNLINNSLLALDTFMVGALGEETLGGVTLANTVFFVVMLLNAGLQSGGMVLISQYWGKRDENAINRVFGIGAGIALAVSALISAAITLFPLQIYSLTTNNPDLLPIAARYARIVAVSYVLNSITMMYIAAQRSMGNTRLGMRALVISMMVNTFLNWVMIFGKLGFPAMGVEGAALATVISRAIELAIVVRYALRKSSFRLDFRAMTRPGILIFKDFLKYAVPVVVNETVWAFGFSLYAVIIGHMPGAVSGVAAYTITLTVERVLSAAYFGAGSAAAILVGAPLGAGDPEAARTAGTTVLLVTFLLGVAAGAVMLILSLTALEPVLFPLFGASGETRRVGGRMLIFLSIATPFKAFNFCNIVGVLRGGGDVRAGVYLDLSAMYVVALPASALAGLVFGAPVMVVYALMNLEEVVKLFFGYWRFSQRKWLRDVTRDLGAA
jgi:putative MATE family efflux protein